MSNGEVVRVRWGRVWLPVLLVVILVMVVYSNTLKSPFVFDDIHMIVGEEARRTLNMSVERWFGTRSLPVMSFDLNYYFGELNVTAYHVVNIGIHVIASVGMFWLGYWLSTAAYTTRVIRVRRVQITNHLYFATLVGLVFALHPIQTQAVTYIVQRLASMATMFYILALLFYVKYRLSVAAKPRKTWGWLSLIATFAAMNSKEIAVTVPIAVLLLEIFFFVPRASKLRWWKGDIEWSYFWRRFYKILPWLLMIIVIPAYMLEVKELVFGVDNLPENIEQDRFFDKVNVKRIGDVSAETREIPRSTYLMTQINVVRTYWRLVVWPGGQNLDHDYPLTLNIFNGPTMVSIGLHVGLCLAAAVLFWRNRRVAAFGILLFYITLLPESSLIPIIDVMFEHRLYLPMVGIALIVGDIGQYLMGTIGGWRWKKINGAVIVGLLVAVLVGSLAVAAYRRNGVWKDEETLWTDAMTKSPSKARPHNNLGKAYLDKRDFDKAEELYLKELELDPESVSGYNNLGSIYGVQGKYEEAIEAINKALELRPDHDAAYNNLGNVYMLREELGEAEGAYKMSIDLNRKDAGVWRNLGDVLVKQGKYEEAVDAYQKAIELVPGKALWHSKWGAALGALGRNEEAKENLIIALQLNPKLHSGYSNLGNVLVAERKYEEAARSYATYLQLIPNDVGVMNNLGKVLLQMGNEKKAREVFLTVLQIDEGNAEAEKLINYIDNKGSGGDEGEAVESSD